MATVVAPGVAEPMVTEVKHAEDLLQICSAIGMRIHDDESPHVYQKGMECRGPLSSSEGMYHGTLTCLLGMLTMALDLML